MNLKEVHYCLLPQLTVFRDNLKESDWSWARNKKTGNQKHHEADQHESQIFKPRRRKSENKYVTKINKVLFISIIEWVTSSITTSYQLTSCLPVMSSRLTVIPNRMAKRQMLLLPHHWMKGNIMVRHRGSNSLVSYHDQFPKYNCNCFAIIIIAKKQFFASISTAWNLLEHRMVSFRLLHT